MRICDWSSSGCSSALFAALRGSAFFVAFLVGAFLAVLRGAAFFAGAFFTALRGAAFFAAFFFAAFLAAPFFFSAAASALAEALAAASDFFALRSEEHTSELQSLMRISYAVFCLKKKNTNTQYTPHQRQYM